jgi:hypothetical protein
MAQTLHPDCPNSLKQVIEKGAGVFTATPFLITE